MKKKNYSFVLVCTQLILYCNTNPPHDNFSALLRCNLSQRDIAQECDVAREINLYNEHLLQESNYLPMQTLEEWVRPIEIENYPKIQQINQIVLDVLEALPISSVCEVGAGCGKICKYLYARNQKLDITCVEHNSTHLELMIDNFERRPHVILPNIRVKAHIVKGSLPHVTALHANSFDAIFTSTVFMHLPFIIAVQAAQEMVRLTKRYILHVENKNDGTQWYNMTIVLPSGMSSANLVGIDYPKLYESLGVKTLIYEEFKNNVNPSTYIVYLGEKIEM